LRARVTLTVVLAVVAISRHAEAMTLALVAPTDQSHVGDEVQIQVDVATGYNVTSATADIAGNATTLSSQNICSPDCHLYWVGSVSLAGVPTGALPMTVNVSDSSGASQTLTATVVHRPIVLTVASPEDGAVATPVIAVSGTCAEVGDACPKVTVTFTAEGSATTTLTNTTSLGSIGLLAFDGQTGRLDVTASDGPFDSASVEVRIAVEASVNLQPFLHVPGYIEDYDGTRVLYSDLFPGPDATNGHLWLYHTDTGVTDAFSSTFLGFARLTPKGAIWTEPGTVEWRDGVRIDHGSLVPFAVAGHYATLWDGTGVYRLDTETGELITIASSIEYGTRADIGANGVVAYDQGADAYLGNGVDPPVDVGAGGILRTDGSLVTVMTRTNHSCSMDLRLPDGTSESLAQSTVSSYCASDFAGGDLAYTSPNTAGVFQAWMRAPNGTNTQLTDIVDEYGGVIGVKAGGGSVYVDYGGGSEVVRPGAPDQPVSRHSWLNAFFVGDHWVVAVLGTLFDIVPTPPPAPDAGVSDAASPASIDGAAGATGGGAAGCCSTTGAPDPSPLLALALLFRRRRRAANARSPSSASPSVS
jgi:hypothetical protein